MTLPEVAPSNVEIARQRYSCTVHHNGNHYFATAAMASIFSAHADAIVERGEIELVPLLHSKGVDLLMVGPNVRYTVVTIEVGRPAGA